MVITLQISVSLNNLCRSNSQICIFFDKPQRNQDTIYIIIYIEIRSTTLIIHNKHRLILASEHSWVMGSCHSWGMMVSCHSWGVVGSWVREDGGAMSHVTGAGVTHYRGAVSSVLINSNNSSGAYTSVVTWNMIHVS